MSPGPSQVPDPKEIEKARAASAQLHRDIATLRSTTAGPDQSQHSKTKGGAVRSVAAEAGAAAGLEEPGDGGTRVQAVIQLTGGSSDNGLRPTAASKSYGDVRSAPSRSGTTVIDINSSLPFEPISLVFRNIR